MISSFFFVFVVETTEMSLRFVCFCSASTTLEDSPFGISQEEANQTLATYTEGGDAEPLSDSSNKIFFINSNVYAKSKSKL